MLYSEDDKRKQESYRIPLFGSEEESTSIPKYVLKKEPMEPRIAYQLVKDQLMDE
ncbi:glutamate decarboxylase, partial [Listeria monocytogenes]|nr:glutamate decarboxylase [Listeria monocytogenes]